MTGKMGWFVFAVVAMAAATGCSQTRDPKASLELASKVRPHRPLWFRLFEKRFDRRLLMDRARAATIPMNEDQLLPLRTGDRVDVLAVFDARTTRGTEKFCATILQNIMVLGVELSGNAKEKGTIRLRVNPYEAQYAILAAHQAELSVILRKDGDTEIYPMEMATFVKLFR